MDGIVEWLLGIGRGEFAGAAEWRIGFMADLSNYAKLGLIVLLALLAVLTIRSYRREGDAPRRAKAVLAGIRILVILLVAAVVFQPAVVLLLTRTLPSSVVLLIDDSLSMSFTDRYADEALRTRTAEMLGIEPAQLAEMSRMELVRAALTRPGGAAGELARDHPLIVLRFSTSRPGREAYTQALAEVSCASRSAPDEAPGRLAKALRSLRSDGCQTDIAKALRDAVERSRGRRVAGIVLISDGQVTVQDGGDGLTEALAGAADSGAEVHAVLVGDPAHPKNVAVTALYGPQRVRRGAKVQFGVVLTHRGLAGCQVRLRLLVRRQDRQKWTPAGAEKTVTLPAPTGAESSARRSGGLMTVRLPAEPNELGRFFYKAVAEALSEEVNTDDNAATTVLTVSDERTKVLLVSGDAGWEFQYLRNFLLRREQFCRLSVWQQNADRKIKQDCSAGMRLSRLPRSLAELVGSAGGKGRPGYDVVILYDPQPTRKGFDENFVQLLKTFVRRHGGGLCYVAGNKYTESVLADGGGYKGLVDMLPIVAAPNTIGLTERISQRGGDSWPVRLTTYGLDHPVTRLGAFGRDTREIWQSLPGVFWSHPVVKAKVAARVLAVSSDPLRRTERNEPEPVIATQPYGAGKVLYVGCDETWRWRLLDDGYYHRRFWSNAVTFLATLRARHVVITAGGSRFPIGRQIPIEAEVYDEKFNPLTDPTFQVRMTNTKTPSDSRTITLHRVDTRAGRYKGTIPDTWTHRAGTYELTALRGDPKAAEKVASKRITIEPPTGEMLRSEADEALMRSRIASRPENFMHLADVDRLKESIPLRQRKIVHTVARSLWDSKLTLLLIALLLAAEWIGRKAYNMA